MRLLPTLMKRLFAMSSVTDLDVPYGGAVPSADSPVEPKAAWWAVFSLSLSVFGLATAEFLPASLLTPIANDLAVSIGAAGQAVTITAAIAAIAGPVLVIGAARYDRRSIVWAVSALIIVSDLIAAFAPNLAVFLVGRVALGIALAGIGSLAAALCMRLVPRAFFSRAMAMIFTGMTAATIFAPPFGVYIGRILGWRAAFVIAAGIGVLAVAAQLFSLPRMAPTSSGDRGMFSRLLRRPGVVPALGAGMLIIAGHSAGFTYIRPFLEQIPRLSAGSISPRVSNLRCRGLRGQSAGGSPRRAERPPCDRTCRAHHRRCDGGPARGRRIAHGRLRGRRILGAGLRDHADQRSDADGAGCSRSC